MIICFLIYNHLSVIAYSSILFVYYMFFRILSTMYPYQHVCKTKRNTALLFAVVLISLFLSLSLSPSIHVRLYLTLSIHFHLHGFMATASLCLSSIFVSLSQWPLKCISLHFVYLDLSMFVYLSVSRQTL